MPSLPPLTPVADVRCFVPPAQEARRIKAQEGKDKMAAREADYTQRERDLKDMKKNTAARTDNDLGDDDMGDGSTMADFRKDIGLKS